MLYSRGAGHNFNLIGGWLERFGSVYGVETRPQKCGIPELRPTFPIPMRPGWEGFGSACGDKTQPRKCSTFGAIYTFTPKGGWLEEFGSACGDTNPSLECGIPQARPTCSSQCGLAKKVRIVVWRQNSTSKCAISRRGSHIRR